MTVLDPNRKYGKLTPIEKVSKTHYSFQCDCGRTAVKRSQSVKQGLTRSCGCLQKEAGFVDNTGKRYGYLVIKAPREWPNWLCQCDCGNEIVVDKKKLFRKRVTSCGCQKEQNPSKGLMYGGGQAKYKKFKFDWHVYQDGILIKMRSSYEVIYANWLVRNGVPFLYEPERFKLEGGDYVPDFYLPEQDRYVELKGIMTTESAGRIERFRKLTGHQLQVIGEDEIQEYLPDGVNYNKFIRNWKKDQIARGAAPVPQKTKKLPQLSRELTPTMKKLMTKSLAFSMKEIEDMVTFKQH